jgi:hypothetical protein
MAIEILAELVVFGTAEAVGTFVLGRSIREWRLDSFFADLEPLEQRAFLEVAAAAVLEDGKLSDDEKAWLDRRRSGSRSPDVVDAAIATATEILPPRKSQDAFRAFLEERGRALGDDEKRQRAFYAAAILLARASSPDVQATTRLFGEALLVSPAKIDEIEGRIRAGEAL